MILRFFIHFLVFLFLTAITQVGGVIYLLSVLVFSKKVIRRRGKRLGVFALLYLISTLILTPRLAPMFGREKVKNTDRIEANTYFTILTNRNYVKPEMNLVLDKVSIGLSQKYNKVKLVYLDANFPFMDGFPLLPHKSHSDGKKIDLCLIYETANGEISNKKKSLSGYGVYAEPKKGEYDQIKRCKEAGHWQYDFPKCLTFGKVNKDLVLSEISTKDMILEFVKQENIRKIFIEPHLKTRLGLNSNKVRFHGCGAVRHDDHIHVELR